MNENEINEIKTKLRKQEYIKAHAEAKITKYKAQLETGIKRKTYAKKTQNDTKSTSKANSEVEQSDQKDSILDAFFD